MGEVMNVIPLDFKKNNRAYLDASAVLMITILGNVGAKQDVNERI